MERIGERGTLDCSELSEFGRAKPGLTSFQDCDVITAKITPCFENGKGALCQGLPGGHGFGTTELHVLRPGLSLMPRFLYYVTASSDFRLAGAGAMSGAAGQKRVPDEFVRNFLCPVPPAARQTAVCAYLDRETARIDALIAKKERLIALLEEKRAALINRAVTKGLDPGVPMKDSGIPWLGAVPAHWEVVPVRRCCSDIEQGWSPIAEDRKADEGEWAVVKLSAVHKGVFRSEEHKALPSGLSPDRHLEIRQGDFLLTRGNTPELVADVCIVGQCRGGLMLSDLVYRLSFRDDLTVPEFILFFFLSAAGRYQIERDARGSSESMVKVAQGHIRSWYLPLPPPAEQRRTAVHLQAHADKANAVRAKIREQIAKLQEYRTALISAAVTGKIDVRESAGEGGTLS